jgi:hypothetical protein
MTSYVLALATRFATRPPWPLITLKKHTIAWPGPICCTGIQAPDQTGQRTQAILDDGTEGQHHVLEVRWARGSPCEKDTRQHGLVSGHKSVGESGTAGTASRKDLEEPTEQGVRFWTRAARRNGSAHVATRFGTPCQINDVRHQRATTRSADPRQPLNRTTSPSREVPTSILSHISSCSRFLHDNSTASTIQQTTHGAATPAYRWRDIP